MLDSACTVDWPGVASVAKDVIVAIAAIVTATVACIGISKWREEESGKADFDLARRLGTAVYRFRDALALARRPFIAVSEFPDGKAPVDGSGASEAAAYAHAYNQRFEGVRQSGLEIQALGNEAEALWDKDISGKLDALLHQATLLRVGMTAIVSDKLVYGANFKKNDAFRKKMETRVSDYGGTINDDGSEGGPNAFTVQIEQAAEDVAAYLRTKLPKSSSRNKSRD
jgi:hypothetical protein